MPDYYEFVANELDVFLERRERRQYVGRLSRLESGEFRFVFDRRYRMSNGSIPLGPSLSLRRAEHRSEKLFPELEDRIPSRRNPAYPEYCAAVGIDVNEADPMVLLATLGRQGPSKFFIERVVGENPAAVVEAIGAFLRDTGLSQADFANLFDISKATLVRVINGTSRDKMLLRLLAIYFSDGNRVLDLMRFTHGRLTMEKTRRVMEYYGDCSDL